MKNCRNGLLPTRRGIESTRSVECDSLVICRISDVPTKSFDMSSNPFYEGGYNKRGGGSREGREGRSGGSGDAG